MNYFYIAIKLLHTHTHILTVGTRSHTMATYFVAFSNFSNGNHTDTHTQTPLKWTHKESDCFLNTVWPLLPTLIATAVKQASVLWVPDSEAHSTPYHA